MVPQGRVKSRGFHRFLFIFACRISVCTLMRVEVEARNQPLGSFFRRDVKKVFV